MLNSLPSFLDIHEVHVYDLKGSSIGRLSSIDLPLKRIKALKDIDFETSYRHGIRIPHDIYQTLKLEIESDVSELRKMMITDFSLMLGIYQLDEDFSDKDHNKIIAKLQSKPQSGIRALFEAISVDRKGIRSDLPDEAYQTENISNTELANKFIMKPLHLIGCPQAKTFSDNNKAISLLDQSWQLFVDIN